MERVDTPYVSATSWIDSFFVATVVPSTWGVGMRKPRRRFGLSEVAGCETRTNDTCKLPMSAPLARYAEAGVNNPAAGSAVIWSVSVS